MLFKGRQLQRHAENAVHTWFTGGRALPSVCQPAVPGAPLSPVTWWMRMLSIFSTGFIICETISGNLSSR